MSITAVLLAGGVGARVGGDTPKQLLKVAGRSLLEHALTAFQEHPGIDDIILVMTPDHLRTAERIAQGFSKVTVVLPGGVTRSDSTCVALTVLSDDDVILIHDVARPFVPGRIIDNCLAALDDHEAVSTVVESADTIWQVDDSGRLSAIPDRASLRRVQTPQGFRVRTLRAAYEAAQRDPAFEATDDCAVVFRYAPGVTVAMVPGDDRNLKVTRPGDLLAVESLLGQQPVVTRPVDRCREAD